MNAIRTGFLVLAFLGFVAFEADACHRRGGGSGCCIETCCWHCCQPDMWQPTQPHPPTTNPAVSMTFVNPAWLDTYVMVWIRHPGGCYKLYKSFGIPAPTWSVSVPGFQLYDELLIETWSRPAGSQCLWDCRCHCCVVLWGQFNYYDVINCRYTYFAADQKVPEQRTASEGTAAASIVVNLPADATLTFDGNATRSTSGERTFTTPALEKGHTYTYSLEAEVVRDGRSHKLTQTISVRPGEETRVRFEELDGVLAARK